MTNWPLIHVLEARLSAWRWKYGYRHGKLVEYSAKVANNRKNFPTHRDALAKAEAGERKWGPLVGQAAKECHLLAERIHKLKPPPPAGPVGEGVTIPATVWNPFRRKIANWIVRELEWAHAHGAVFTITSGLRTYAEQAVLYQRYLNGGNIAAKPGESNHEGFLYPRGAIDTADPIALDHVLRTKPNRKLIYAESVGLADTVHFSGTGR